MSDDSFAAARSTALELLEDLAEWQLAPARWAVVAEILAAAEQAALARDAEALDAAMDRMDEVGPSRIIPMGSRSTDPPPVVRERVNHLVHALGKPTDEPSPPEEEGREDGRGDQR